MVPLCLTTQPFCCLGGKSSRNTAALRQQYFEGIKMFSFRCATRGGGSTMNTQELQPRNAIIIPNVFPLGATVQGHERGRVRRGESDCSQGGKREFLLHDSPANV